MNTQTFVIDPLSGSESSVCIHDRLMTEKKNPSPILIDLMYVQAFSAVVSQILQKCFIDKNKLGYVCVCAHMWMFWNVGKENRRA